MKKIGVFIADDHMLVRAGLRMLLEATEDMEVVGEAENGEVAVRETRRLQPDVVLMDLSMPGLSGVEATRRISKELPQARILILSGFSETSLVQQTILAGATGYLMKQTAAKDLLTAVRQVCNGNAFFSPRIAKRLLRQWEVSGDSAKPAELTARQTEVLGLIAHGYSNLQMAEWLAISIKTVEKHRQSLMHRLDIHEVAGLTRYAVWIGAVELEDFSPPCKDFVLSAGRGNHPEAVGSEKRRLT
jgi:DNA-binding NarL/FixJ family response regulator